jgi:hypothetical protein
MIYIWLIFVLISSVVEAFLFDTNKFKTKYKHFILTIIRGVICLSLAFLSFEPFMFILFCLFSFPFLHDGIYYTTRHLLNKKMYPKMWIDQSSDTNAVISLSFFWRLILFIFSLGMLPVVL